MQLIKLFCVQDKFENYRAKLYLKRHRLLFQIIVKKQNEATKQKKKSAKLYKLGTPNAFYEYGLTYCRN